MSLRFPRAARPPVRLGLGAPVLLTLFACFCLVSFLLPIRAAAQALPRPRSGMQTTPQTLDRNSLIDLRRRLIELDRLLALESLSRAESLLNDLAQHSQLERELVPRRIRLAQLKGDHEQVLLLCRATLVEQQANPGLWRVLAGSLLATSQPDSARLALDRFFTTSPNLTGAVVVGVEMLQGAGRHQGAVAVIDSLRGVLEKPRFLSRARALSLLQVDRQGEAAVEMAAEMSTNPYNLPLLRQSVLETAFRPFEHREFMDELVARAEARGGHAALRVLAANLLLVDARTESARELVEPLLENSTRSLLVLQNAVTLTNELRLLEDRAQLQGTVDYLLAVLAGLMEAGRMGPEPIRRAADHLARTCETALDLQALGEDPREAVDRFSDLLQRVRRVNPQTESLYSSQIRLAAYTRDVLRDAPAAARRLERMLLDLDLPTAGVALVRLTLGECYLAAGDTARGRTVLTRLGRDADFRAAGGHAHYHLARLDLAEGHFGTARDRFAVVAIDHPDAPYANEALEMGLAIAEEMENPSGGPHVLEAYAPSVYFDLVDRPAERTEALERFAAEMGAQLDLEEPQHLLERGRFELAELYAASGRTDEALEAYRRLVGEHPEGRFAAVSLVRRAELMAGRGSSQEAGQELELLLAQYPDYLFVDDVRDLLRGWQ